MVWYHRVPFRLLEHAREIMKCADEGSSWLRDAEERSEMRKIIEVVSVVCRPLYLDLLACTPVTLPACRRLCFMVQFVCLMLTLHLCLPDDRIAMVIAQAPHMLVPTLAKDYAERVVDYWTDLSTSGE